MEELALRIAVLVASYLIGTKIIERRHYKSIKAREKEFSSMPTLNTSETGEDDIKECWLVSGSTVISIDVFKKVIANFLNFFGGRVLTYETLLDRAKRESVLRMKEKARMQNADGILNLKIETSSINKGTEKIGSVEILAYGTAFKLNSENAF